MGRISNNQIAPKIDTSPLASPYHNAKQAPHQIAQDEGVQKSRQTAFAFFNIARARKQVITRSNMELTPEFSRAFANIYRKDFKKMVKQRAIEEAKPETQGIPIRQKRQKQLTLLIPKERPLKIDIKVHGPFPTVDKKTKENTSYKKSTNCHRSHLPSVWAPWAKP